MVGWRTRGSGEDDSGDVGAAARTGVRRRRSLTEPPPPREDLRHRSPCPPPLLGDRDLPAAAARPLLAGGEGVQGSWVRLMSTSAASQAKDEAAKAAAAGMGDGEKKEVAVNSYWGIEQSQKLVREAGTEWKWSCFKPWETYTADTSIDLTKHHKPKTMLDKIAYYTVKSLRFPTDIFFQCRKPGRFIQI